MNKNSNSNNELKWLNAKFKQYGVKNKDILSIEDEVKNDLQIRAGFDNPEAVSKAIDFLSVKDVIESTSVAKIFLDVTVSESLSSSSPYKHVDKVVDLTREISGGEFIGNSFAPGSEGSFVYNP